MHPRWASTYSMPPNPLRTPNDQGEVAHYLKSTRMQSEASSKQVPLFVQPILQITTAALWELPINQYASNLIVGWAAPLFLVHLKWEFLRRTVIIRYFQMFV